MSLATWETQFDRLSVSQQEAFPVHLLACIAHMVAKPPIFGYQESRSELTHHTKEGLMTATRITLAMGLAWLAVEVSAAPFVNLDFEDAVVPGDLLPGWEVNNLGPSYNIACLGSSCVSVHDAGSPSADPSIPLQGTYSVFLQAGTDGANGDPPLIPASITQTGDMPVGAKTIELLSTAGPNFDPFISFENLVVAFDGNNIPLTNIGTVGNVVTLSGDVSPYAGMTGELLVGTLTPDDDGAELWAWVDAVSITVVPEPTSVTTCLIAATFVGLAYRRRI